MERINIKHLFAFNFLNCNLFIILIFSILTINVSANNNISNNTVLSQQKLITVKGTVVDKSNKPLIGATIIVKGTASKGSISDTKGNFIIDNVNVGDILEISSVGYKVLEVPATEKNMRIVLTHSDLEVGQVIVTGYGTVSRNAYAGAASVVTTEKLKDVPTLSVQDRMAGNVAGLTMTSTSGQPGSVSTISIRGLGSVNASSQPLYVIDGVPVQSDNSANFEYSESGTSIMASLNPNDIESISVIKDAAAASLYGSRAANGVIVITTKKGKSGKTKFNVKADVGITDLAINYRPVLGGDERRDLLYSGLINSGIYNPGANKLDGTLHQATEFANKNIDVYAKKPPGGEWTNWYNELFRIGISQNYEMSASGGNDNTQFYTSLSYKDQEGIVEQQTFNRITGALNVTHKYNRLTLGLSSNFSRSQQSTNSESTAYSNPFMLASTFISPADYPYNEDGSVNITDGYSATGGALTNPIWELQQNSDINYTTRSLNNVNAQLDIIPGLFLKQTLAYDFVYSKETSWWSPLSNNGGASNGVYQEYRAERKQLNSQTMLNYSKTFNDKHTILALGTFEVEEFINDYNYANGNDYASDLKPAISNAGNSESESAIIESKMLSFVSKLDYTFDNRIYIGGSFRRDGSSRLAPDVRWGNFWSVSSYWRLSQESWWSSKVISSARIRASYGENGTQPLEEYDWIGVYDLSLKYNNSPAIYEGRVSNKDLRWERNLSANLGFDISFFESRLTLTFDWYNRDTKDLILNAPVSLVSGYNLFAENVGEMRNRGFEIDIKGVAVDTKNWNVTLGLNIARNKNTLTSLNSGVKDLASVESINQIHRVGESFYSFNIYEVAGVDTETGKQLYYKNTTDKDGNIIDRTLTDDTSEAQRRILGNSEPLLSGGFNLFASYKNFDFGATFTFSVGGKAFDNASWLYSSGGDVNYTGQIPIYYDVDKMWKKPGDVAELPKFEHGSPIPSGSSNRLYDTDHLRLKNFTLGYRLPENLTNKIGLSKVRIFASGSNLFTINDKDLPFDPETPSHGLVTFQSPALRTIILGIDISF